MLWMTIAPWISSIGLTFLAVFYEEPILLFGLGEWTLLFGITILTMGLAITPTTFISLLCGYFLGFESLVFVVICYQMASLIGFQLANVLDHDLIRLATAKFPKSEQIFDNVKRNQWLTTIMARISPALPFGLMNVVLSITGIRRLPFFVGGLIGMLPRTAFFLWLGSKASLLKEALQSSGNIGWSIAITLAVFYGFYLLLKPKVVTQSKKSFNDTFQ
jgi:uncharacterized membrane protein YdjX (TVP38/TMEM64 family)